MKKNYIKILPLIFLIQSCGYYYQSKLDDAMQDCEKELEEGIYKDKYEMTEKCWQPKEREILSGTPDYDLILLRQAKTNELSKKVKEGKLSKEEATTKFMEYNNKLTNQSNQRAMQRAQISQQQQLINNQKSYQDQLLMKSHSDRISNTTDRLLNNLNEPSSSNIKCTTEKGWAPNLSGNPVYETNCNSSSW